jgi:hypothetical protein
LEIGSKRNDEKSTFRTLCKEDSKTDANETTHLGFDGIYIHPKMKEEQIWENGRGMGDAMVNATSSEEMTSCGNLHMEKYGQCMWDKKMTCTCFKIKIFMDCKSEEENKKVRKGPRYGMCHGRKLTFWPNGYKSKIMSRRVWCERIWAYIICTGWL